MEGIFNMAALEFSIRPHSYQALVLLRVLHEVGYGQNHVNTGHEQKNLIESFVNEVLMRNANRAISGDGPLVYKEAKGVFEEIYDTTIEGQEKKAGKHDVYSEFARARKCEAALALARAENLALKAKVTGLENRQVPNNRGGGVLPARGNRGARGARGGRGRGAQGQWKKMKHLWLQGVWYACNGT
jgi:hypothetical protein